MNYLTPYYSSIVRPTDYTLSVDAAVEPLSLTDVKEFLKVTSTSDDDLITSMIITARNYAERVIGRDLINKTWITYLDCFPSVYSEIEIAKSKLQSITSIQYYLDDVLTTVSSSIYYITDKPQYSSILVKENQSWPTDEDNRKQSVVITFVSGYGAAVSDVPEPIKQGMLSHIAAMYENRGDCSDCSQTFKDSQAASLYRPYVIANQMFSVIDGLL